MARSEASCRREGERLVLTGTLDRASVTHLWPQALHDSAGASQLVLIAVDAVDSAGLALLAELASRLRTATGTFRNPDGEPAGLADLCAAYRLGPDFTFNGSNP